MSEALQTYFTKVGKYPLLTREQEITLAKRIEAGDRRAKNEMIQSNLRLAISIAKKYQSKGCSLEDLIQESNMGLIKDLIKHVQKAVKKKHNIDLETEVRILGEG